MAAEKGAAFTLSVGDGATAEVFTVVGGMRTTGLTINNEMVDITDKDSGGKRELLAAAGIQSVSISAAGVFKDAASEATVRGNAQDDSIDNYKVLFGSGDDYTGAFQITSLEYTGEHNGARQYTMTLESSGAVTYTSS